MFERYHKVARTTCQTLKGHAPRAEGEDFQPRYGRSLKIKSNLELKIEKEVANCTQSVNRKPSIHGRILKQIGK